MNHLDTFSGIGGWALAARWMKWNTLAFVEKETFCHKVLNKNFPSVPIYDDIFTFSAKPFLGRVDVLTGSTPCQPFSAAGKRQGSNDERHLFPEFLRVVAECRPTWIVLENVYGLLNIESGQVFEDYHASLESEGYAVQTVCIPASAVNAPHRRDRVWFVANALHSGADAHARTDGCSGGVLRRNGSSNVLAGSVQYALDPANHAADYKLPSSDAQGVGSGRGGGWNESWFSAATRLCRMDDGLPYELDIIGSRDNRTARLKGLGNAIVPQIAYEIFRAIEATESLLTSP